MFRNKVLNIIIILSCAHVYLNAQIGIGVNSVAPGKITDFKEDCKIMKNTNKIDLNINQNI